VAAVRIKRRRLSTPCGKVGRRHGVHFLVVYRLGGRGFKDQTGGTFCTLAEAQTRRDVIAGEIAALRDPRLLLEVMRTPPAARRTYEQVAEAYAASRHDHSSASARAVTVAVKKLAPLFEGRDPLKLTWQDQVDAIAELSRELKPASVHAYWQQHRLILDYAGCDPNPARDRRVKLPKRVQEEVVPPSARQVLAMLECVPRKHRLPLITIEQTAMAVGEFCAAGWGDVDEAELRFRLRRATVKGQIRARARMVQVPAWLMPYISDLCPLEDRTAERQVFMGQTGSNLAKVMARACMQAGVPQFSPHDLRHRRLSLWHGQGVPAKQLAERAGHSQASMTLDVYSHVMIDPTEITVDEYAALLARERVAATQEP